MPKADSEVLDSEYAYFEGSDLFALSIQNFEAYLLIPLNII